MVIGKGLIAKAFDIYEDNDDVIIFASGVSDSGDLPDSEYLREINTLLPLVQSNKHLIYFSTTGVYDPQRKDNKYIKHKLAVETLIADNFERWTIFRLPNVIGNGGNSKTMVNFFVNAIKKSEPITIQKYAVRRLMDVDDVFKFVDYSISNKYFPNQTINLCSDYLTKVPVIVEKIETIIGKKANAQLIEKGSSYTIPNTEFNQLNSKLEVRFDETYLERVLFKYFGNLK